MLVLKVRGADDRLGYGSPGSRVRRAFNGWYVELSFVHEDGRVTESAQ